MSPSASPVWSRLARLAVSRLTSRSPAAPRGTDASAVLRGAQGTRTYPGDFSGTATIEFTPSADGDADPGEVVWGWVPFEEDHSLGKDRPALVVARDGHWVLALMLSSKDHDDDRTPRDAPGGGPAASWLDVGTGAWDARRRPSEVRLDRVLRLDPGAIRREGAVLDRQRFERVAAALRALHGWA